MDLCSNHFSGLLCWPVTLYKDPIVWLDGAIQPLNMLSPNPKTLSVDWLILLSGNAPNVHGVFINKKYVSKYIKICKIGAMRRLFSVCLCWPGILNKDPIVWLDGAIQPLSMLSPSLKTLWTNWLICLYGNTPNVHGGFIDPKMFPSI